MFRPSRSNPDVIFGIFLLIVGLIFFGCSPLVTREPSPEYAKWSSIKSPVSGEPRIYGSYQSGCLAGAQQLPLDGAGYSVVRRSRNRYYGHPAIIGYLTELGKKIRQKKYPSMIIEDISYPRGGPFLNGHISHQIGLDVDISLSSKTTLPTLMESENWVSTSYVKDRKTLLTNWGREQIQLTELAASSPEVNRIFVAPAIKKYFCENQPYAPWLYKIRSWWGHDDHLHVRLNCPTDSPDCKPQAPLDPVNNSCGVELDWWYSAEADVESIKQEQMDNDPQPRGFPILPAQCEEVKETKY